ncbi:MAG: NADPH-dependent reductase [Ilumatobacteraceae bacterium]|jgi:NAD(P)H-dependent FMN reductase|nr:NADPH-dependent reductase [Ilumatobacteraceae bacterium]
MSAQPIRVALIVGSTRDGRFGHVIGAWFARRALRRDDIDLDVIDLVDIELPGRHTRERSTAVEEYIARLDRADAFVVVTPEYNHSYPASLKHAIDLVHAEWQRKPVAFVSYGGLSGGLRAVEHLRQVFAEVHAATMRDTVSFHNPWPQFDETGELRDAATTDAAEAAVTTMLDQLVWWADALRTARAAQLA